MNIEFYEKLLISKGNKKKLFALLIDPDKFNSDELVIAASRAQVDIILVGGSILTQGNLEKSVIRIKKNFKGSVYLFPGNFMQISNKADGILLLSLISGRNPELLIGNHVLAAPMLKQSKIEIVPTGYMLIESEKQTAALYMSNTNPIPYDKKEIAACTALAGEMLGMKLIYLDGGSGANKSISAEMIKEVRKNISIPLIIGGGIDTAEKAKAACKAGADVIVVGTAIEKNKNLLLPIAEAIHSF
jgi:putative glycerol-1-phosphate prenyltransferase